MKLRARIALTAAIVIVPTMLGLVALDAVARHRAAERLLGEIVDARLASEGERERCEADPAGWSMRGGPPREHGPPRGPPPREGRRPRPAEMFAYDDAQRPARADAPALPSTLPGPTSDDIEIVVRTPWGEGPCAWVLARGSTGDWGALLPESWLWALPTVAVLLAVLFAVGPVVRRVRRLTEAVERTAAGGYRETIAGDARDEIGELARAFDAAGRELREQLDVRAQREAALREFLANTTHDVMIPITVLQGHLATLRDRGGADADVVAAAMTEAQYMASLLQNLAAAARLDATDGGLQHSAVDLGELVARVVARHRPIAAQRGVAIEHAVPDTPTIASADLTLLEQAVGNLVHNAVRYNHDGGHVAVVLEREGPRFSLRVIDDGPGIAAADLDRIVTRGARGDLARTRVPEGQGLGLHIALRAAALHDYTLTLTPASPNGLEARMAGALA